MQAGGGAIDDGGFAFGEAGGGSAVSPNVNITNGATLSLVSSNSLVLSGILSGTGGAVSKFGAGTATLNGTNNYTGATTVESGKLVINGNISTSLLTTVKTGGTLGGSGTTGAVTVLSGGTLAPGTSPGILNVGDTVLEAGSTLGIEINGATIDTQYDQLNVIGSASLSGLLAVTTSYTPTNGTLFFILANNGSDPFTGAGTFSNATDTTGTTVYTFGPDAQQYLISYTGNHTGDGGGTFFGTGNDVVLMAVPEPNAAAVLGGLGVLALLRRKRAQRA